MSFELGCIVDIDLQDPVVTEHPQVTGQQAYSVCAVEQVTALRVDGVAIREVPIDTKSVLVLRAMT